jgi:hypothetical protein
VFQSPAKFRVLRGATPTPGRASNTRRGQVPSPIGPLQVPSPIGPLNDQSARFSCRPTERSTERAGHPPCLRNWRATPITFFRDNVSKSGWHATPLTLFWVPCPTALRGHANGLDVRRHAHAKPLGMAPQIDRFPPFCVKHTQLQIWALTQHEGLAMQEFPMITAAAPCKVLITLQGAHQGAHFEKREHLGKTPRFSARCSCGSRCSSRDEHLGRKRGFPCRTKSA